MWPFLICLTFFWVLHFFKNKKKSDVFFLVHLLKKNWFTLFQFITYIFWFIFFWFVILFFSVHRLTYISFILVWFIALDISTSLFSVHRFTYTWITLFGSSSRFSIRRIRYIWLILFGSSSYIYLVHSLRFVALDIFWSILIFGSPPKLPFFGSLPYLFFSFHCLR